MDPAARWIAAVPVLGLIAWAIAGAAANARADLLKHAARADPNLPALESLVAAAPGDPAAHEMLAAHLRRFPSDGESRAVAERHLVHALRLRPVSPYAWATLAESRYLRGDTGPGFELALRRAIALGPAEPEVQRMVSDLGLAAWTELGSDGRQAVAIALAAGFRRNAAEILRTAHRRGRLDVACGQLAGEAGPSDARWRGICQSTEALR